MRILIFAAALSLSASAAAQELSREEILRSLNEQVPQQARPGVRIGKARGMGVSSAIPAGPIRPLAFRQIQFAFGSAELTRASAPTLDVLAEALTDVMGDPRFGGMVFPIIGYTDAKGSEESNLLLSQRRADAVVRYLVARGIPASRLVAIGRGERDLADPDQPDAAINRRVEVRVTL
jgi:OmpA-OmpF porin, OOP family